MKDKQIEILVLERLRIGDAKAFEQVFLAYYDKVKNFKTAIIKSKTDAEDLAQDIFVKLWHHRDTVDPQKSFNSYMYALARNAAFNYLKHLSVCQSYLNDHVPPDMDISPEDIIYAKEIRLQAEMVVSQMPEQRRKIYTLSRNHGLTNDEIASRLGVSKKNSRKPLVAGAPSDTKGDCSVDDVLKP